MFIKYFNSYSVNDGTIQGFIFNFAYLHRIILICPSWEFCFLKIIFRLEFKNWGYYIVNAYFTKLDVKYYLDRFKEMGV